MFSHYRTKGFLLKKSEQGDSDEILNFYTEEFGKIDVLARSIRKIKSKLRAGSEPFSISEIEFVQGRTFKTLVDAFSLEKFSKTSRDLKKIEIYSGIIRLLDFFLNGQEKDEKIWNLSVKAFKDLEQENFCGSQKPNIFYLHFFWNLVFLAGYGISFYDCIFCQKKLILGKLSFSAKAAGILCPMCFGREKGNLAVFPETIKILRFFLENNWNNSSKIKTEEKQFNILGEVSRQYFCAIKDSFNLVK